MPCYDPPPAWEGRARDNACEAARLLCSKIGADLKAGVPIPDKLAAWYVKHRMIDAERLFDFGGTKKATEIAEIMAEIQQLSPTSVLQIYAVVTMFGKRKRCLVDVVGPPQAEYSREQTYWAERAEDEYGVSQLKPPSCVLRRGEWLRGREVPNG